jgi:CHAT domain-containing protein
VDQPTSHEVIMKLLFGDWETSVEPHSYIGTAGGLTPGRELHRALDCVLPWLGETVATRLHRMLVEASATGVTLIPSGPLGLAPLHAADWSASGRRVCLLDEFPVRFTPSGALQGLSLQRAASADGRSPHFVGLGNPSGAGLPAAEVEIGEIATLFGVREATTAIGADATVAFLQANLEQATHLHFACHGYGSPVGFGASGIILSDGEIAAEAIPNLGALAPRLTVVSACQTAISDIADLPDEVFSLSSALLAGGSAGVIASLWPVDDFATALLMARSYEVLINDRMRPPEALRRAQLWLRDLTEAEEQDYLAHHPTLETAFRVRQSAGTAPGRRGAGAGTGRIDLRPYAHPEYWAAFIALGA